MYKWYANCAAVVLDSNTEFKDRCTRGWCSIRRGNSCYSVRIYKGSEAFLIDEIGQKATPRSLYTASSSEPLIRICNENPG
ncbi:hypothetical protein K450DRAFT_229226 [Umbelopsis ramanniana AG]|uniref:Uncharacterized protein n=1 Tax=Umbelopsis ramanniana AG TaxID=1314678 RepID=A0AAD5EED4_UMBRA|nr:uncharacterized protein K450DRAFT_229226 [Umbelopsis ramanniana AG]KAI8582143.1 hypothetical protein K450DRAFT_229226 [Umbelopsis ramanniana AG]